MHKSQSGGINKLLLLSLGALGVVFGDIGTSPLYAINEIFFGHSHTAINEANVFGAISLVFWAITIVICFKYVFLVLRADNDGEGGVFSLYSLLIKKAKIGRFLWIAPLLIFSSGLLFGDGMITPAISVLSAVEGLKVITSTFSPFVVPITIIILTFLFLYQKNGTHKVGKIFGPVVMLWFATIGILGLYQIIQYPQILMALNPLQGIGFLLSHSIHQNLLIIGSVMLVITGGEALYADLGHFGRSPIKLSWFTFVYPALLLNYFGQGAFLLSGREVIGNNIFYNLVPHQLLIPMVILATCATVIASQALISGAFSIASQAIRLGLMPRLKIVHTHHEHEGQIYIPFINWLLFVGCIFFVVTFKTSANLASAYGLAVSGDMVITSLAMIFVSRYLWNWNKAKSLFIFLPLLAIDISLLTANALKFIDGGFIPFLIGISFFTIMSIWQWGRREVRAVFKNYSSMTIKDLINIKNKAEYSLPRSIIIMTPFKIESIDDVVPPVKQIFWERYGLLPKNLLFLTIRTLKVPYVKRRRYEVNHFYDDSTKGKITNLVLDYGFMEDPDVEKTLHALDSKKIIDIEDNPSDWLIHTSKVKLIAPKNANILAQIRLMILDIMFRFFNLSDYFFGLGNKVKLTMEVIPVNLKS